MASRTINGWQWPDGTVVSVYLASAQVAGSDNPSGSVIASGTVVGGSVTLDGLQEKINYVAHGAGKAVRFRVDPARAEGLAPAEAGVRPRLDALEELLGAGESRVRVRSLREFYTGSSQPADVLGYIQDGLAWSALEGGLLLIPDDIDEPWSVGAGICPPPNSRMIAANAFNQFSERLGDAHGAAHYQLPASPNKIGEAWIRLANGVNGPILYNDYTNAQGKRGPDRGGGTYWQWFSAIGITFDHNGRNQTGALRAIDIRKAWGMNFPFCRLVAPRGQGFVLEDCNSCDGPFTSVVGDSEKVANGTGDTTSGSPTIANASGTWAIGDLIAGPGIPGDTYVSNVVGSTLTLAKAGDGTAQNATATATGAALTKPTFLADYLLAMTTTTTDSRWPEISMHGAKTAGVLLDSVFGNRVTGFSGYCIGGHNLWLRDTGASGNFQNRIDLRLEQATKHNARIDQDVRDNPITLAAYTPGLFNPAADADGGWVNVFCDGKSNVLMGAGDKRVGQPSGITAVVAWGLNARENEGLMGGGADLPAGTPIYVYRGAGGSSITKSSRRPGPGEVLIPGIAFEPANGSTAAVATFNTTHRVMSFPAGVDSEAVYYFTIPTGGRRTRFRLHLVNMNAANSGNARFQIGYADVIQGGGTTLGADEQTIGPAAITIGANQQTVQTSFTGTIITTPAGDFMCIRVKRTGSNVADTLASAVGLLGVFVEPSMEA
jgi:hypothetical protein